MYAFIALNEGADSPAIYKTGTVFGHGVAGITFNVNDKDPAVVDTITFHIAPSGGAAKANHVKVQTRPGGTWTERSLVNDILPTQVATCIFGSLPAENVTALKIVAR